MPSQSYVLFKNVKAPSDVKYLGAVRVTGKTLHKVAIPGALLIHPSTIPDMSQKEQVDDTELAVVIDDAGRPRSGTWKLWGQVADRRGDGPAPAVDYDIDADLLEGRLEDHDQATLTVVR